MLFDKGSINYVSFPLPPVQITQPSFTILTQENTVGTWVILGVFPKKPHREWWVCEAPFINCISSDIPGAACFPGVIQGCSPSSSPKFYKAPYLRLDFKVAVIMVYVCAATGEAVLFCRARICLLFLHLSGMGRSPCTEELSYFLTTSHAGVTGLAAICTYMILLPAMVTAPSKWLFKKK